MKIQLASDLHLEVLENYFPGETLIRPARQADVLVLAGDIAHAANAVQLFSDWPVPVLYVMGNHEAYGGCFEEVVDELRQASKGSPVQFLERDAIDFGGVRFLGCTLWTDYRLRGDRTQEQLMAHARERISDHFRIRTRGMELFSPEHALSDHEASRSWLAQELNKQYAGRTVVVTHHGPHPLSVHPRYAGNPSNAAFVSDLSPLLHRADVWVHGHVHDTFRYSVAGCHVYANPRGYARNASTAKAASELQFENSAFEHSFVIDVNEHKNAGERPR